MFGGLRGVTDQVMRATIEDVARRAGVSIATVSRVVNNRYGVAPATMTRVREIVADMGYESSLVARSLRSARTNVIGVLVADIEPFSAELLKGVAKALRETDFELVVYAAGQHRDAGWERRSISRLSGTLTDGTILVTPTVVDVPGNQPVVAVDPHVGRSSLPTVDSQNFEGAVAATEHLLDLGHRRIGFLGGRPDLESARRRDAGYRAALAAAGIPIDPDLIRVGGFTEEHAAAPARELLQLDDRPTAVFAANDLSAIQTMRTAAEIGLAVPRDLSVVGFDNIPESVLTEPPLTTVDQSIQDLGYEAVRLLIALVEDPERGHGASAEPIHITLPTELVVRQSSGPPPPGTARGPR
jgi:LacI family transcriptional regulator